MLLIVIVGGGEVFPEFPPALQPTATAPTLAATSHPKTFFRAAALMPGTVSPYLPSAWVPRRKL